MVLAFVVELAEEVAHRVEPRPLLVIAANRDPRGVVGVGAGGHRRLGVGVGVPAAQRLQIHRGQLPSTHGVDLTDGEAGALLPASHGEPELRQVDAGIDDHPLELRRLLHEDLMLLIGAEAHDALHPGPVVPGPVEQHDLAGRREVLHIALEVPLTGLGRGRLGQRDHPCGPRVEVLHESLDRAALARCVTPLEQQHMAFAVVLRPVLELQQLDLQSVLLLLVGVPVKQLVVRVVLPPGLHRLATRVDEQRIRTLTPGHRVPLGDQTVDVLPQVVLDVELEVLDATRRAHVVLRILSRSGCLGRPASPESFATSAWSPALRQPTTAAPPRATSDKATIWWLSARSPAAVDVAGA